MAGGFDGLRFGKAMGRGSLGVTDEVARAICAAAGRYNAGRLDGSCQFCDENDGICQMWETFRDEAREAVKAAYKWHKRERRWPSYAKLPDGSC